MFGAKIKLVAGYPGTNEIPLAMERGEVDGLCGLSWSTLKTRHPHWLKERKANILVQAALQDGSRNCRDVPLRLRSPRSRSSMQILNLILTGRRWRGRSRRRPAFRPTARRP